MTKKEFIDSLIRARDYRNVKYIIYGYSKPGTPIPIQDAIDEASEWEEEQFGEDYPWCKCDKFGNVNE